MAMAMGKGGGQAPLKVGDDDALIGCRDSKTGWSSHRLILQESAGVDGEGELPCVQNAVLVYFSAGTKIDFAAAGHWLVQPVTFMH